ncbi:MAG: nucleotidyltransferase domain-containing protein [Methyloversatilis sp.]|uniref:nucleotidyltransferase domain-containing protein n=1 Tax=Methyloversatilis sp. TaxID=2569862 RepID=UPI00273727E9|nr:nucleotidyltransferase domain-containing protein [Methyloversatilis sp.]MDP3871845.1 nucleotidyltransferase domain-containing protein [Methyloversatilis sp.]
MGSNPALSISSALFTNTQQRVLGLLFGRVGQSFHTNEIVRLSRSGSGAVNRELKRLAAAGLLIATRRGNQMLYQANPGSPVFAELRGLIAKTSGVADHIRLALASFAGQIHLAFIYGSVARGAEGPDSDVDLLVISDTLLLGDLYSALAGAEAAIGRPVNPSVYSLSEWRTRIDDENPFVTRVMAQPRILLIGNEHDLAKPS